MTVEEYLDELMNGDAQDSRPADPEIASQVTPEMSEIIDELELQWLEPTTDRLTLEIILALVHKYTAIAKLTFFARILTFDRT